jgi:hypothetical protein
MIKIFSELKLVLDINSDNSSITFKNKKLDHFDVVYKIVEKSSDLLKNLF